jgi:hypothetical protein
MFRNKQMITFLVADIYVIKFKKLKVVVTSYVT